MAEIPITCKYDRPLYFINLSAPFHYMILQLCHNPRL